MVFNVVLKFSIFYWNEQKEAKNSQKLKNKMNKNWEFLRNYSQKIDPGIWL